MADAGIARYYDRLNGWNALARAFGHGGGRGALTVHRPLADPAARGRATTTRLHDLLIEYFADLRSPHVLDAGCGLGGTMLDLASRIKGHYLGVTLSSSQAAMAQRAASARGLADSVRVLVQNYDNPPPGPFDLVLAIEALAHSASPSTSLRALAAVLAPGGTLVVVDDMPEPAAEGSHDLLTFTSGWRCPALWGHQCYLDAFAGLGLDLIVDRDLTGDCRPRTLSRIAQLEKFNRFVHRTMPWAALRDVMDSHYGGLALERLARTGAVRYRMLVARPAERAGSRPQAPDLVQAFGSGK